MDLYQIFITHNRAWTVRETIGFSILFTIALLAAIYLLRSKKIILSQAVSGLILMMFLGIVFGSTVFTRHANETAIQSGIILVLERSFFEPQSRAVKRKPVKLHPIISYGFIASLDI